MIDKLCGLHIQRRTSIACARSSKARGDVKATRSFVHAARRYHAKARALTAQMPADELAHFFGWRVAA